MHKVYTTMPGEPYPLGVHIEDHCICFSAVMEQDTKCGVILYHKGTGRKVHISFPEDCRHGHIYSMKVKGFSPDEYTYNFYEGSRNFTDPYVRSTTGFGAWGAISQEHRQTRGNFPCPDYDWEGDLPLRTPYENSVFYCLHVRGFTMHPSSHVKNKGTFRGVIEKIPYLKELGITALELMPAYELDEVDVTELPSDMAAVAGQYKMDPDTPRKRKKINYWGFKEGFYFAPRYAYSADKNPEKEFKDLVKELHRNGIEVILQFYFTGNIGQGMIMDILKFWVTDYHIDGFHLKGRRLSGEWLVQEPLFADTKLLDYDFSTQCAAQSVEQRVTDGAGAGRRNLASYRDDFMYEMRRFLKGDGNMLEAFIRNMTKNPSDQGVINYLCNYYGFTLTDLVSYENKHNEANGEGNCDGNDYNVSWNCGVEGPTRRKPILALRMKQIKNGLTMLFLSQGTPLIYSGDEMGNTQYGNNNPYCQDNRIGWVKWPATAAAQEILQFTRELIALRREHPVLHPPKAFRMLDSIACGYPDLSFHGKEAWRADYSAQCRSIGMMYCGSYARLNRKQEDHFFYIAYNMYWEECIFALPKLPKGMKWYLLADTDAQPPFFERIEAAAVPLEEQQSAQVEARAIHIYAAKYDKTPEQGKGLMAGRQDALPENRTMF